MASRTMTELRKLEDQRKEALKRIKEKGDPMGKEAEGLESLDRSIAARMGISVDQLQAMRK